MKLFEKLESKKIRCLACSHKCIISEGKTGICGVRENKNGNLKILVYGEAASIAIDPIEKKPLYDFMPETRILSLGTLGCNFKCDFCQNYTISQKEFFKDFGEEFSPEEIVNLALESNIPSIAYTYNEPAVFFEYAYDTGIIARKKRLKNVFVSNGFLSEEAMEKCGDFLDAANFDLKSFSDDFYKKICGGRLKPVLENIKRAFEMGIHLEITTLLIPGENDSEEELKKIANFIAGISKEIPWHISRFFPCYKMTHKNPTPLEALEKAKEIGESAGLKKVYLGNV